jgi:SRSO17 transposase
MAVAVSVEQWQEHFDSAFARIAGRFGRVEPRRAARDYLLGVLSDVDTRSCWQLAEQAGHRSPHRLQSLLAEAVWDADAVRDDLRLYVVDELGDRDGVLIVDDFGDLKSGSHTVGVQRQYTGTAGRIENAQVATYLAYASHNGRALIDRELYLPKSWTDDRQRCQAAGVPDTIAFATKVAHARRMLARALDAGVPAAWVTADEFYGNERRLRRDLQIRTVGYVLAVARNHRVTLADGAVATAEHTAQRLPRRSWNRLSAGQGAKGERRYDWAWVTITPPADEAAGQHWLLLRRRIRDGELAFYRCWSPTPVSLATLVRIAGTRWCVEECFRAGKDEVGLDQHQVRTWTSWYRYTTLAMLAHAILTVIAAHEHDHRHPGKPMIALTVNEIRHLFAKLITRRVGTISYWLHWSTWRRRHQHRALISHYRRRGHPVHSHPSL